MIRHEIRFDFPDRKEQNLENLNEVLARLELSDLELEDFDGYTCTATTYTPEGSVVRHWYGLEQGVLVGEADEEEKKYHFQIMTEVLGAEVCDSLGDYHDYWMKKHPNRFMRSVTTLQGNAGIVYVVLHHEK